MYLRKINAQMTQQEPSPVPPSPEPPEPPRYAQWHKNDKVKRNLNLIKRRLEKSTQPKPGPQPILVQTRSDESKE